MTALPIPTLMLVTDRKTAGGDDALVAKVRDAVAGGVNVVQVRAKEIGPMEQVALAERVREAIAGRALLIVNGWSQVAEAVNADGVHLPEDAPATTIGSGLLVGRSVHTVESARRAEAEGADYIIAGPIYETPTHPGANGAGVELVADVVAAVSVPVIAIGGIDAEHVRDVMAAGASGIAVVSAVLGADDAEAAARALRDALGKARERVAPR
jgi:thiamine-phosphate diphosphorylase